MRYPIGTRVRLVQSTKFPHNIGAEGVVIGHGPMRYEAFSTSKEYQADFDGIINSAGFTIWGVNHDQIEPIINDGNDLSTWDECIKESGLNWRPGKVPA